MNEASLITCGALKTRCSESLMGYCGSCGNKWTDGDTVDDACPICSVPITKYTCSRCDGQFTARSVSTEHACQSVIAYQASGKVAFEEEGRAARDEQQRVEAAEKDRVRRFQELEKRARQSEIHAAEVEKAKAQEVEAAIRRAKEAEDRLARTEAALRESESHGTDSPAIKNTPTKTLKFWSWVMVGLAIGVWGYLRSSDKPNGAQVPTNTSTSVQRQPVTGLKTPEQSRVVVPKFPRCAGSYEPKKCEELEERLSNESAQAKAARIRSLEQTRQSAMNEVMGNKQSQGSALNSTNTVQPSASTDSAKSATDQPVDVPPAALSALSRIVSVAKAHFANVFGQKVEPPLGEDSEQRSLDEPTKSILANYSIDAIGNQVTKILVGVRDNDAAKIESGINALKQLRQPSRGDRKTARRANNEALKAIQRRQFAEAIAKLTEAAKADPLDVEVVNNLAYALHKNGKLYEARIVALCALSLSPTRSSAWAELGTVLAQENKADRAVAALMLTYRFSQNQQKTRDMLKDLIDDKEDPLVQGAALKALNQINQQ